MLFDNLVKNGKSYNTAIGIIMEKTDSAINRLTSLYDAELARENYANYMSEGFVLNKREEDYLFDNTEATPGITGRMIRVLQEAWENIVRWIKATIFKIKSVFIKKEVAKKVSILEKIAAKNPFIKNKKIEIPDPNPPFLEKIKNDIEMIRIKLKTGKSFAEIKRDMEELERKEKQMDMLKKGKKVAIIVVSIAAAIVLLKQYMDFRTIEAKVVEPSAHIGPSQMESFRENTTMKINIEKTRQKVVYAQHFNIFVFLKETPDKLFKFFNGMKNVNTGNLYRDIYGDTTVQKTMKKAQAQAGVDTSMFDNVDTGDDIDDADSGSDVSDAIGDVNIQESIDDYIEDFLYNYNI